MKKHLPSALALIGLLCVAQASQAALILNQAYNVYQTYGNVNVYSLPYNALTYNAATNSTGTGPGNPYYIGSTPGDIKDQVVIYTGSNGDGVTTNTFGFDDAYGAPNGTKAFATTSGTNVTVPTAKPPAEIANASANTWDASLLSLKTFLNGGDAAFLFNNNDTNDDQSLAIWAKIWVTDANNNLYGRYLYLSNMGNLYGFQAPTGGDASLYDPGNIANPLVGPNATDYIMSGGQVCFDANLQLEACTNTSPHKVNHNLGANQVAYAGVVPVLEGYFDTLFALTDNDLKDFTLHLDLRLGCDPAWGQTNCANKEIDNGYEQLWLMSVNGRNTNVPEPASLAMLGLGLAGLGFFRRRRAVSVS